MSKNWSWRKLLVLMLLLLGLSSLWFRGGFDHLHLNTDLGRDLTELSQIWQGNLVWLGPRLSPGLHASSFFYYSLFPALWVASGDARGLVIFNLSLAAVVLGSFGWYGWKVINKF